MKWSKYFLHTLKENPQDAEIISHQLMIRSGMIRKLGAGIYTWLPLGLRVLHKVSNIVRGTLDEAGCHECLMPSLIPANLWQETDRWDKFGSLLLKIQDRNQREYCYGPTHEEVVTEHGRAFLNSYKQLPVTLYQIQTKFRDEIRPRYGVMRAREFTMKDAYSFHENMESLQDTYQQIFNAYHKIFQRIGLKVKAVLADTGSIGGDTSHEFHVLADSGEDTLCLSNGSDYAANLELAEAVAIKPKTQEIPKKIEKIATQTHHICDHVAKYLKQPLEKTIKSICVRGTEEPVVMLLLRGDHNLNDIKAEKHPKVSTPLAFIPDKEITERLCAPGNIGPVNVLDIPIIADSSVEFMQNFICGANEPGYHFQNTNLSDINISEYSDLRNVVEGDDSPDQKGRIYTKKGIEVGHIFQLGDVYSKKMNLLISQESGKKVHPLMGCYGIGISRIVAASIEQNHDERGIIWPEAIAPFQLMIMPIGFHKSPDIKELALNIYQQAQAAGLEVLLDDRGASPGQMFAEGELIGIPHQIILGERKLKQGMVEYKNRQTMQTMDISIEQMQASVRQGSFNF